ncbi:MAG TPA: oxygenase MpaB family protein [Methylomirabilota bacterium]|nr:oxygenase MpaB family protein [Methylomirabilota bacterium]
MAIGREIRSSRCGSTRHWSTRRSSHDGWIEPLDRDRRARYYEETLQIGRAFGVPANHLPADLDAFETYVTGMLAPDGPVRVSGVARELADAVLHPPLGPVVPALDGVPSALYAWTLWPAIGLLPEGVRDDYGLSWGPFERAIAAWLVAGWRAWRPILPPSFRQMPQALAADRRIASATPTAPVSRSPTGPAPQ